MKRVGLGKGERMLHCSLFPCFGGSGGPSTPSPSDSPRMPLLDLLRSSLFPCACLSAQVMGEVASAQQQREKQRCEALLEARRCGGGGGCGSGAGALPGRGGSGGSGAADAEADLQLEYAAYVVAGGCVHGGEEAEQKLDGSEGGPKRKLRE